MPMLPFHSKSFAPARDAAHVRRAQVAVLPWRAQKDVRKDVNGSDTTYKKLKYFIPCASMVFLLIIWQLVVTTGLIPNFLLPAPTQVLAALIQDAPLLYAHSIVTLQEALIGLGVGTLIGVCVAVLMDRFLGVRLALNPLITISQTIPTIALAPLLVLWFGYDLLPKVVLVVVTTSFPITLSLIGGFAGVNKGALDLMRTMGASYAQQLIVAKIPAAAEAFFSGLAISSTYAIVSAVIAEWLGGFWGLGVYMTRVRKSFAYDRMFAAIVVISLLSLVLLGVVRLIQKAAMPWKNTSTLHAKEEE